MNILKLEITKEHYYSKAVKIIVDDVPLENHIANILSDLESDYSYMELDDFLSKFKKVLVGEKVNLLICSCGVEECSAFAVRITEVNNTIVWDNFCLYHKDRNLTDFKPFIFDRRQYLDEFKKIKLIFNRFR
jgi:hypothetical protein